MDFIYNIPLESIEKTKEYKQFRNLLIKALYHQWEDVIASGVLNDAEELIKKKHLPIRLQEKVIKAVHKEPALPSDENKDKVSLKDVALLLATLQALVKKKLKPLKSYFNITQATAAFLLSSANKSGQQVLDQVSDFTGTRPKVFQLVDQEQLNKLQTRVDTLMNELDAFTIVLLAREIKKNFELGLNKQVISKNLMKTGENIAETRGTKIAETELEAVHGYTRNLVARLNGFEYKEWYTVGDDRVCPVCSSNSRQVVKVTEDFNSGHGYPPAHIRCRCSVSFFVDNATLGIDQLVEPLVNKSFGAKIAYVEKKKKYTFYLTDTTTKALPVMNPEAQWVGSNSLIGKDKEVGNLAQELQWNDKAKSSVYQDVYGLSQIDKYYQEYKSVYASFGDLVWKHPTKYFPGLTQTELTLLKARLTLSDIGYLQLLKSKGYTGLVSALQPFPIYPKKPYTDIVRRHAQNVVKVLADSQGRLNLDTLNITSFTPPAIDTTEQSGKQLSIDKIDFEKPILSSQRVISIMDNFEEAQRRGGEGITVQFIPETSRYVVSGDGNHRLFAAKQLGYKDIYAQTIKTPS